jgi:hypothetical protein
MTPLSNHRLGYASNGPVIARSPLTSTLWEGSQGKRGSLEAPRQEFPAFLASLLYGRPQPLRVRAGDLYQAENGLAGTHLDHEGQWVPVIAEGCRARPVRIHLVNREGLVVILPYPTDRSVVAIPEGGRDSTRIKRENLYVSPNSTLPVGEVGHRPWSRETGNCYVLCQRGR